MSYSIEPAYALYNELLRQIMKASTDPVNKWFFTDGSFSADMQLERVPNTWNNDNFVVVHNRQVVSYFESHWNKPLNIITGFRLIVFDKTKGATVTKALFDFFDYLFTVRGCRAFNWTVAEKNFHAHRIYEKFIKNYFGHGVGKRHCGQMAYNGEVSDVYLYEITEEEYFNWKKKIPSESNKR